MLATEYTMFLLNGRVVLRLLNKFLLEPVKIYDQLEPFLRGT